MDKNLLQDIQLMAQMSSGSQKEFFEWELSSVKEIQCVPLAEVFTKRELQELMTYAKPVKRQCFMNAAKVVQHFYKDCIYVEGRVLVCGIPIDHAFVKVRGFYVDPTLELCRKEDVTKKCYASLLEVGCVEMMQLLVEQGFYGSLKGIYFANNIKQKKYARNKV